MHIFSSDNTTRSMTRKFLNDTLQPEASLMERIHLLCDLNSNPEIIA